MSREEYAVYLRIPRILVDQALLDGCLDLLIDWQLKTFRHVHELDEDKIAPLKEAMQVSA